MTTRRPGAAAGTAPLRWDSKQAQQQLVNLLMRNARAAGAELRNQTKAAISGRGTSAAGQAPGLVSGKLRRSIRSIVRRDRSASELTLPGGSGLRSRRSLATRTARGAARPFLGQRFQSFKTRMAEILLRGRG